MFSEKNTPFRGDALCYRHRRDPSRLRADDVAVRAAPRAHRTVQDELRHLRRLTATCFATQDHNLVVHNRVDNVLLHVKRRQALPLSLHPLVRLVSLLPLQCLQQLRVLPRPNVALPLLPLPSVLLPARLLLPGTGSRFLLQVIPVRRPRGIIIPQSACRRPLWANNGTVSDQRAQQSQRVHVTV